jgi:hypothetical protein
VDTSAIGAVSTTAEWIACSSSPQPPLQPPMLQPIPHLQLLHRPLHHLLVQHEKCESCTTRNRIRSITMCACGCRLTARRCLSVLHAMHPCLCRLPQHLVLLLLLHSCRSHRCSPVWTSQQPLLLWRRLHRHQHPAPETADLATPHRMCVCPHPRRRRLKSPPHPATTIVKQLGTSRRTKGRVAAIHKPADPPRNWRRPCLAGHTSDVRV